MSLLLAEAICVRCRAPCRFARLGYGRAKETPISLDYRFTRSGVSSMAGVDALVNTVAVFYRLRILGFYQRRVASHSSSSTWASRATES